MGHLSLLTLIGAAIGFAKFDPYSTNPSDGLNVGSGIFGVVAPMLTSFLGAFFALRIAGDRRRTEALMHGGICWALSVLVSGMLVRTEGDAARPGGELDRPGSGSQPARIFEDQSRVRGRKGTNAWRVRPSAARRRS